MYDSREYGPTAFCLIMVSKFYVDGKLILRAKWKKHVEMPSHYSGTDDMMFFFIAPNRLWTDGYAELHFSDGQHFVNSDL